ncbi:general secretion pathway protein GspD [Mucilaginibacter sp. Bleaf8]|uniref:type II secretion system protein GspD n=1 Tax=Mucilaginibacter sp. Bleaf8 TaxID=2834430 RepID=UPI001BCB9072|nr:general secretion pathway protein GspD [Mucilaginibacter sp. Bleaf8]MBS7565384.1 general secretion pathway protein GspD [Mucilaginibacter sp. Bleaf8]
MVRRFLVLLWIWVFIGLLPDRLHAQQQDRIQALQQKLEKLAVTVPGLNDGVQLAVTGVSLPDFLNALSKSNGLSLSVDPKLTFKVYNNFNNVTAINILIFLAKQYNLDITPIGSILYITQYQDPAANVPPPVHQVNARYNQLENTLSLELNNDTLSSVAKRITQLSNKNVVVPIALQNRLVTSFISNAPFETALEKLAYANDLKLTRTSDNFYLFQGLEDGEQLYVNSDKNTAVRKAFKPAGSNAGSQTGLYVTTVAGQKLISADATNASILDLVKSASFETNKSYFLYSEIRGNITLHVAGVTYEHFLSALFQGTDYTFTQENGIYMIGDRKLEGLRTNKVIQLQNRAIDTVLAMIPNEWKRGVEIKEFREQNTLLLSGSKPQIAEIESLVKQIDLLVPMVLIEVTLLDIRKNRTVSTGITAGISDSIKTGGKVLPGIDYTFGSRSINDFLNKVGKITSVNLGHVTPNFYATISALEASNNVEVRSVPKLSTLNGHPATLSIGTTRYYEIKTQNVIPSLSSPTSIFTSQFNKVDANLAITIRPMVSGDDQVTLNIKVDISDFIGIPPDNAPPPTSNSKFESILRAHNEDMIVLGGIERTENSENASGVPLLSRIPVLKWLFSSRTKTRGKVVTVVFIKPTIIR